MSAQCGEQWYEGPWKETVTLRYIKGVVIAYWAMISTAVAKDLTLPDTSKDCWSDFLRHVFDTIREETYLFQVVVIGFLVIGIIWAWRRKSA